VTVDDFFSRTNPLVRAILRSPLHWLVSGGLILITVTGRRTGRQYTIPVGYQRDGDALTVIVSEARKKQWWRNYREPSPIGVRLRGRERTGSASIVVPGSERFRAAAQSAIDRIPGMARVFGIVHTRGTPLTADQTRRLGANIAIVRIELEA
jgi:deazaflavin-dependent oxidoreductase (nitroreductase family)